MDDNINKIQNMLKSIGYTGNTSYEYTFTVSCVDYFYYNKDIGSQTIIDGFTDGSGDGGIDFICDDGEYMYLIQGKTENNLTYKKIRSFYKKILDTVNDFKNDNTSDYNDKLKSIYRNVYDKITNPKLKFVIFTKTRIDDSLEKKIQILNKEREYKGILLEIYGIDEIESQQQLVDFGATTVDVGKLILLDKNYIEYKSKDGLGYIFRISANSLKSLYEESKRKGLFGYNLREHFDYSPIKVDEQIKETIKSDKKNFWFYNNGITIGCSKCDIYDNSIELYSFSIINGAQTTFVIGENKKICKNYDFDIVCKVVVAKNSLRSKFIHKISEASNSQKPIIQRDLKANSEEQRKLYNKFLNNGDYSLYIEIKRNNEQKIPNKFNNKDNKWKKIKNDKLAQIILSTQYQRPGTARSNTKQIFENPDIYSMIFDIEKVKSYNYNTLYDLVRLDYYYDEYKKNKVIELNKRIKDLAEDLNKKTNDLNKKVMVAEIKDIKNKMDSLSDYKSMCVNAKFAVISIISYFIKRVYFNLKPVFQNPNNEEKNLIKLEEVQMTGDLSLKYKKDDYLKHLNSLFDFFVEELSDYYNEIHVVENFTSHSNFLKLDSTYRRIILKHFEKIYETESNKKNQELKKVINNSLIIFNSKNSK